LKITNVAPIGFNRFLGQAALTSQMGQKRRSHVIR
jgi:hypothetical protein